MHTADARKMGETEQRLYCISAWRECTFYTDAEKVALELTEHVTLKIPTKRLPDELYQRVREYYDERQYADLIFIINQINSWNRISIAMGNTAVKITLSNNIFWCLVLIHLILFSAIGRFSLVRRRLFLIGTENQKPSN